MKKSKFYLFCAALALAACSGDGYFESDENENLGVYNEKTGSYMTEKNEFAVIDSYKPKTMAEREEIANHWNTSRKETRWQEYKGTMVRIEILLGDSDVREMRLRLMQNSNGTDVDGDIRTILGKVADYEMKRVCGRNAESIVMVYDRPSSEIMRPTTFYDYRIEAEGASMREYAFRCVYND
ncbi:MAG: hypothetical protein J6S57_01020 [Alphaproteobacteria bacterium]|nr:hypothetical protein [Alphaproteobacteria bacterium]